MIRATGDAVAQLDSALRVWATAADQTSRDANAVVKGRVADVEAEVRGRRKRLAAAEAALAAAKGDARASLARDVRAAEESLQRGRRALGEAKDADRRAQLLTRRISDATANRVPNASKELHRKLAALADYASGGGSVTTTSHRASGSSSASAEHKNHPYARLAAMIGVAVADNVTDALAQTADQATARMPDRIGDPLSAGAAIYHEIRGGWDVYRLTPEFLAMHVRPTKPR